MSNPQNVPRGQTTFQRGRQGCSPAPESEIVGFVHAFAGGLTVLYICRFRGLGYDDVVGQAVVATLRNTTAIFCHRWGLARATYARAGAFVDAGNNELGDREVGIGAGAASGAFLGEGWKASGVADFAFHSLRLSCCLRQMRSLDIILK